MSTSGAVVSVVALAVATALAAAGLINFARWSLPPWRAWRRQTRGLSQVQRWQVGAAVQCCRPVRDPALAPAILANIAYRRRLLALSNRRGFIALRICAGLALLTITVTALIGHPPSGHTPPPLWNRMLLVGPGLTLAAWLLLGYRAAVRWMQRRLDRCQRLHESTPGIA